MMPKDWWRDVKVKITDSAAIHKITPEKLISWLSNNNWECVEKNRNFCIYEKSDMALLIPSTHEVRDYILRVAQAIGEICQVEHKTELVIYEEIMKEKV